MSRPHLAEGYSSQNELRVDLTPPSFPPPSDLYTTALAGSLDATSGFATLVTHTYLFVWNYVKVRPALSRISPSARCSSSPRSLLPLRLVVCLPQKSYSTSPTLYAFPVPSATSLCHPQLVRHPAGREPGVLVVSPQGEVRFWEGVSQALVGGGERFVVGDVTGLKDDEDVMGISEVEVSLPSLLRALKMCERVKVCRTRTDRLTLHPLLAWTLHHHHLPLKPSPPHPFASLWPNNHLHRSLPSLLLWILRTALALLPLIPLGILDTLRIIVSSALVFRSPAHLHRLGSSLARDLRSHDPQSPTLAARLELEDTLPRL